ncbi:anti-virulence regulator CigR family protein [Pseudomonas zhanjiangensis]|uniref:Anti-virulence regulator CigR family protein n=1 Tax=Pseudomonas zhanjiangensis TaxID=3239015 RepID=A0ABV3Z1N0_9PSED
MPQTSRTLLLCSGLALALATQSTLAAPKHDKADKHAGGHDSELQVQLNGPSIDIGRVRIVLGDHRQEIGQTSTLPPGIAKNLARGKPLPPGIAKNFDGRVASQLPHYDGYEWKRVGTDVVLVAVATGIVYEVLRNLLD